jgi:hypothetical protein
MGEMPQYGKHDKKAIVHHTGWRITTHADLSCGYMVRTQKVRSACNARPGARMHRVQHGSSATPTIGASVRRGLRNGVSGSP